MTDNLTLNLTKTNDTNQLKVNLEKKNCQLVPHPEKYRHSDSYNKQVTKLGLQHIEIYILDF